MEFTETAAWFSGGALALVELYRFYKMENVNGIDFAVAAVATAMLAIAFSKMASRGGQRLH